MPVYNELQEIHQYFSIRITIDHKKKLEEEREVYIRNLEEIIFQISHKVRQPVTQIIGLAKILSYNLNDVEPEKEELIKCINYILSATENLDMYTGDLATFTHESKVKINILV